MTREQIFAEAKALDARERQGLIDDLSQITDADELTPEQLAELRRRKEAVDRGEMELLDGEQVMAELRERFKK